MGVAAAVAAASAVATVGSALISSNAAGKAASAQTNAANNATATQLKMYEQTRSDLSPFMGAGTGALGQLANIFGFGPGGTGSPNAAAAQSQLTAFPGYQFGLDQGIQGLDRSAASRGLVLSGAQLKDAQAYGQGYAQQQAWQPYISELNQVSGLGESAAAGVGNAGITTGAGVAQSQLAAGQAAAGGAVAQGNILGSGLNQLSSQLSPYISSYGNNTLSTSQANAMDAAGAGAQLGDSTLGTYVNPQIPIS